MNLKLAGNRKRHHLLMVGHVSFLIMLMGSLLFYKERVLFSDSAFQFFKIVNFEGINIEAHRYAAILPQLPVLLFIKLGVGLKWLTALYSGSFILLYYFIFICCAHLLKNIQAGLAILFTLTLCVAQSFFHPVTETHQSLVFSILFYAILQYSNFSQPLVKYLLSIFALGLSFFAHPVAIYPLTFIIVYVAIEKKQFRTVLPYLLSGIVIILTIGKLLLTKENSYEGKFFSELLQFTTLPGQLPKANSTKFFIERVNDLYSWLIILHLILLVKYSIKGEFLKLSWQLFITAIFTLITLATYHKGDAEMLMERAFMPLALFVVIPLLSEFLKENDRFHYLKLTLLTALVAVNFGRIYNQGVQFKTRTCFNQNILKQTSYYPNRKFIANSHELQKYHSIFWSHAFEMLLLSSITAETPTQTIFPSNNLNKLRPYTSEKEGIFLGTDFWLEWNIGDLNQKYFQLPNTTFYKEIKVDEGPQIRF